jgi:hypothetical protein
MGGRGSALRHGSRPAATRANFPSAVLLWISSVHGAGERVAGAATTARMGTRPICSPQAPAARQRCAWQFVASKDSVSFRWAETRALAHAAGPHASPGQSSMGVTAGFSITALAVVVGCAEPAVPGVRKRVRCHRRRGSRIGSAITTYRPDGSALCGARFNFRLIDRSAFEDPLVSRVESTGWRATFDARGTLAYSATRTPRRWSSDSAGRRADSSNAVPHWSADSSRIAGHRADRPTSFLPRRNAPFGSTVE